MAIDQYVDHIAGVNAPSAHKSKISVAECLALVKYLNAGEDLSSSEEQLFGELENDLQAELIADEFTGEINRLVDLETPESAVFLESFALWSKGRKGSPRH